MRIAIDARFASGEKTGVGKYTFNLIKALSKLIDENELHLFVNEKSEEIEGTKIQYYPTKVTPQMHPANEFWENIYLPLFFKRKVIDIFHSPAFFIPLFTPGTKRVVTIHDLAVFKFPETFPYKFAKYLQFMIRSSTRVADRIIVVSGAVKDELVDLLKVKKEKISVIHEGIEPQFFVPPGKKEIVDFIEVRGLLNGFILYAGTIEPRKNIINLIRAFNILKQKSFPHKLVLAGKKGWLSEPVFEEIKNSRFRDDIILTGYISDEELKLYYSSCDAFVYPSLYEGFGLPPLEAMACGAPVVVSDIPVFREILGEGAMFVIAVEPEGIAEGIESILKNRELREKLKIKKEYILSKYTWESCAEKTVEIYKEIFNI